MCLRRLSHTVLQISILQIIFAALVIVTIHNLTFESSKYPYDHIQRKSIWKYLYIVLNPDLRIDPALADCKYDFIYSTETISRQGVDRKLREFNEEGIWNGSYSPSACNPVFSSAVLVTFRNREEQLHKFIPYIHTFLKKQNIHYKIFVIEQHDEKPWNKGVLYNVGARIAIAEKFPCLILHDVDLMPLDAANIYACNYYPRHMSASIDKFRYVLPYEELVGGVTAVQARHYQEVNGFSNKYEGWGAEDDDFSRRLSSENLPITRFPPEMSRYIMLRHRPETVNKNRFALMRETNGLHQEDGLNSLAYSSITRIDLKLYTLVQVKL